MGYDFSLKKTAFHQLRLTPINKCYDIRQIALIHYKLDSIGPLENLISIQMCTEEGASAVSINYTEEGQSVGGPYTVLSLNNCLLEHISVYGRVSSCNRTQSPKRTNCSLGMLAINASPAYQRGRWRRGDKKRELWRMSHAD